MRHIAYNAVINLISVQRGFRANEMPFFRIPANGIRRSAYFIEEQGDSLKSRLRVMYFSRFVALTRVPCSLLYFCTFLLTSFDLRTVYRATCSRSRFHFAAIAPRRFATAEEHATRFRKSGVRSFIRCITYEREESFDWEGSSLSRIFRSISVYIAFCIRSRKDSLERKFSHE